MVVLYQLQTLHLLQLVEGGHLIITVIEEVMFFMVLPVEIITVKTVL
jgi:hypothetical protein